MLSPRTGPRRRKPQPTYDGRVPGMRAEPFPRPIYSGLNFAELGAHSWWREYHGRDAGLTVIYARTLGTGAVHRAVTDDFGNLVVVH